MKKNIAILNECKVGSTEHVSTVVSSLAIIVLVDKYAIELTSEEVKLLLSCLLLEADPTEKSEVDPTEKRCSAYKAVLTKFSAELRE